MKREFDVDGFHYVAEFKHSEFIFYIDTCQSSRQAYVQSRFECGFGDEPPDRVFITTENTSTCKHDVNNVFKVKREVLTLVDHALKRYRPYYFCYRTLEPAKLSVFDRIAMRIAKRHGYYETWDPAGAKFVFYRLDESETKHWL